MICFAHRISLAAWLTAVLLALGLAVGPGGGARAQTVVRVGYTPGATPVIFLDAQGEPQGIVPDILRAVADDEGWSLEFEAGDWPTNLRRLEKGQVDLLAPVARDPATSQWLTFNHEVLLVEWGQLYALADRDLQSLTDLDGLKVAIKRDDAFHGTLMMLLKRFGVHTRFVEAETYEDVLGLLRQRRVDAGVLSRLAGPGLDVSYPVRATPVVFEPVDMYVAAAPGDPRALLPRLDTRLRRLKADPNSSYHQTLTHWLNQEAAHELPHWLLGTTLAVVGLLSLLFVLSVFFRVQVRRRTLQLSERNQLLRQEVAQRRQAQEELQASEERYRTLVESAFEGVAIALDAKWAYVNKSFAGLYQRPATEILDRPVTSYVHDEDRELVRSRHMARLADEEPPNNYQIRLVLPNGEVRWVELEAALVTWEGKRAVLACMNDLTQRQAQHQQEMSRQKLLGAVETAGAACHELSQPLQALLMNLELMEALLPPDFPQAERLAEIQGMARRMAQITRRLTRIADYQTRNYLGSSRILDLELSCPPGRDDAPPSETPPPRLVPDPED